MKKLILKTLRKCFRERSYNSYDFNRAQYSNEDGNALIFRIIGGGQSMYGF